MMRSIPACTGKPPSARAPQAHDWVYPRMYGETASTVDARPPINGLSPHVRGNLVGSSAIDDVARSIPACTGKPLVAAPVGTFAGVYPRMYGETHHHPARRRPYDGLSPHVRGNRMRRGARWSSLRSIPACTGKPGRR